MEFLQRERSVLARYLPHLEERLAERPLLELESPESDGIKLFREAGGPALLIPTAYAGLGASPLEAIQIQRAIASRSPSLAIATTMHHFSIATLVEMCARGAGLEGLLLEGIARQRLLVASGFAEGQSGRGILASTMQVKRNGAGLIINGSKKPCSLSRSMDLLTASIPLPPDGAGAGELAVVLIPAQSTGVEHRKFWETWVLAGAESDEIVLRDVAVPSNLIFRIGSAESLDLVQISGFLWFELLISASYLGMASALVERVVKAARAEPGERTLLGIEVEGAMAALEGVARALMAGEKSNDDLARVLFVRYMVERAVERASGRAVELLGGMAYVRSSEISYLFSAARALAFHPPSRTSMSSTLAGFLAGGTLTMR